MTKKILKGSWKTTAVGILTGIGILASQLVAVLDTNPETVFSFAQVMVGLAALGLGWFARDNKVSSENAGAK